MRVPKFLVIISIAIIIAAALINFFFFPVIIENFFLLFAQRGNGTVENATELPYVGRVLEGFPAEGKINYAYIKYYGHQGVLFTGKTTLKMMEDYCNERDFGMHVGRKNADWDERLKIYRVDAQLFPIGTSSNDRGVFGIVREGVGCFFFYISFRQEDGRYTAEIWHIERSR